MADVLLETLDIRNNVLRRIDSGRIVMRSPGGSLAWIPDRKPNEARLQARRSDGTILSRALLTDEEWRLEL